ncbi:uncharacterized protein EKO05_0004275 [Ascochyta rabiei]|uniref:Ricin B lectin domain-containing protein n=1 Tax=Didymella rabiei TaxID=5454 RepID=A0A162YAV6_DIDRA|nr:uncharacterized protein EKO05_0004275 [Ascochyta rabiei]KZM19920.1 hypothetical protein ST47_g9052 [Ascochyta rabiei]UPX13776.1 hypothetical protein EKO05_0004275 [Ascochyta rabiei]
MFFSTVLIATLAIIPSALAQFNGHYTIKAIDGTSLAFGSQSKVFSIGNAPTKNGTFYITSGPKSLGYAFITGVLPSNVLTATGSYTSTNNLDNSQASGLDFYSSTGNRSQQAWKINSLGNGLYEIESAAFPESVLDIRGDGSNTRQVLVYSRNGGSNQKFRIIPFSLFDTAT